jgi:hypothetical protein
MKTGNGMHYAEAPHEPSRSANCMEAGASIIANLPAHIREELNYRLSEGEPGIELVEWLNAKPEVINVIRERFDGLPISDQNLSEWRKRGYQKWLAFHNFVDESNALGDNAEVLAETGIDCDKLLLTLTAAYAEAIQNWIVTPCEQMTYKLAVYKNLTNGVIALRRAEIQKVRLEIERERLELLREKRRDKSSAAAAAPASSSGESPSTSKPKPADQSESELPHSTPSPSESRHSVVAPSALPVSTSPKPSQPNQPTLTAMPTPEQSDPRHSSFELRHSSAPGPASCARPTASVPLRATRPAMPVPRRTTHLAMPLPIPTCRRPPAQASGSETCARVPARPSPPKPSPAKVVPGRQQPEPVEHLASLYPETITDYLD